MFFIRIKKLLTSSSFLKFWWCWIQWCWIFFKWIFCIFWDNHSFSYSYICNTVSYTNFFSLFSFIFISWRLITLQYCSGFCHTLTWISHGFTFIPHPDPLSHLPLHPIPLGLPSAPGWSTCLMHPVWAGDLFHPR